MTEIEPLLSLRHITRRFGQVVALDAISLDIAAGQVVCLVGHSGCGKSTLLRVIAGVERADGGTVTMGGAVVSGEGVFVEPEDRKVGFMFQDYALFPHLSVRQNIGFGLSKLGRAERNARIDEIINRIGISHLADRFPHMLSGGEQQRVALARALAPWPSVLLMDEPFSNLDRGLRDSVRRETLALIRALGATAIIVTHDPEEALAIGDVVVLMAGGRLVEMDTGEAIYSHPRTGYAAAFFSHVNRLPARRAGDMVETPLGRSVAPAEHGDQLEALVRPHALRLSPDGVPARVESRVVLGEMEELVLSIPSHDEPVIMRSSVRQSVTPGDMVSVSVDPAELMIFPAAEPVEKSA